MINIEKVKEIVDIIDQNELSPDEISDIFRALHRQDNCLGGKIWTKNDIQYLLNDEYDSIQINSDKINEIIDCIGTDDLNDCYDSEWAAFHDAIKGSKVLVHVENISWDIKPYEFDSKEEYQKVKEALPEEVDIPLSELHHNSIENYLSDNYDYCVKGYKYN